MKLEKISMGALRSTICCSPTCSENLEDVIDDTCVRTLSDKKVLLNSPKQKDANMKDFMIDEDATNWIKKTKYPTEARLLENWDQAYEGTQNVCKIDELEDTSLQLRLGRDEDVDKSQDKYHNELSSRKVAEDIPLAFPNEAVELKCAQPSTREHKLRVKKCNNIDDDQYIIPDLISNRWNNEDGQTGRLESIDKQGSSRGGCVTELERWESFDKQESLRGGCVMEPRLHSIHKANVFSIKPFGIYVDICGFKCQGFVHYTQITHHEIVRRDAQDSEKIRAISTILHEGDEVWVKIISRKQEKEDVELFCSIKSVSQDDGRDLDPNNVFFERSSMKPTTWQAPSKQKNNVGYARLDNHENDKLESHTKFSHNHEMREECTSSEYESNQMVQPRFPPFCATSIEKGKSQAIGIPGWSMPTSIGRGRAMVTPAWMTHGIGVGGESPAPVPTSSDLCTPTVYNNMRDTCCPSQTTSTMCETKFSSLARRSIEDNQRTRKQKKKERKEARKYHKRNKRSRDESNLIHDPRKRF